MKIDDIVLGRNPNNRATFILHIEAIGCKFTGEFADFGGMMTAVSEAAQFFLIKAGKMKSKDQTTTRPILHV
jgi:hypothetical protein